MITIHRVLSKRALSHIGWVAAFGLMVVAIIQYFVGAEVSLFIIYGLPIGIVGWKGKKATAHIFAVLAPLLWLAIVRADRFHFSQSWIAYWNTFTRFIFFEFEVLVLFRLREQVEASERKLASFVSNIEVCNACSRIKDSVDYWNEIPDYIEDHFNVTVTRKICPGCARMRYINEYKNAKVENVVE